MSDDTCTFMLEGGTLRDLDDFCRKHRLSRIDAISLILRLVTHGDKTEAINLSITGEAGKHKVNLYMGTNWGNIE